MPFGPCCAYLRCFHHYCRVSILSTASQCPWLAVASAEGSLAQGPPPGEHLPTRDMSGLKIVLKLNRPKPAAPTPGEDAGQSAAAADAPPAAAPAPPVSVTPVVAAAPSGTDGRSHGHKEKKEKKKHKHKHGERDRAEHAAPADGAGSVVPADGEPPRKKAKKHKESPPGACLCRALWHSMLVLKQSVRLPLLHDVNACAHLEQGILTRY